MKGFICFIVIYLYNCWLEYYTCIKPKDKITKKDWVQICLWPVFIFKKFKKD